jgi:hypothetical protein
MRWSREMRFGRSMFAESEEVRRAARRAPVTLAALVVAAVACAPALQPLSGAPVPSESLPVAALPAGHQRIVFRWQYGDPEITVRGDGAARVAPPDSVRLDFFLGGGMGSGGAVLIGDEIRAGGPDFARRMIPPPPLLWAALGRLAVPATADTSVATDGALVRGDLGSPVQWRVAFRGDTLVRLERVDAGRVVEWVQRDSPGRVRYRHESGQRELSLEVVRTDPMEGFDDAIWTP